MAKKIIVVVGGFADLNLEKELSKDQWLETKVVDRNNYHYFPPLLYTPI